MKKIDKKDITPPNINTQGAKKLKAYFSQLIKSHSFCDTMKELKSKYNIKPQGYDFDPQYHYPIPPKEYDYHKNDIGKLILDIEKFCEEKSLYVTYWTAIIWNYLFYHDFHLKIPPFPGYTYDVCIINDRAEDLQAMKDPQIRNRVEEILERENKEFPIAICISPYASQRDIVDYIKKHFNQIKCFQDKYKKESAKIGKIKTKNPAIEKINDFVHDNKNKPIKETRKLLAEKDIFLDDGSISKIRSAEKKKRADM